MDNLARPKQAQKTQNKSVYTRRFNKLKAAIIEHYGAKLDDFSGGVCLTNTASLRWGPESCIVAHDGSLGFTLYFDNDDGTSSSVSIVKTPLCSLGGLVGIHVQDTDLHHMIDAVDTALKDGFDKIYIRSIGKLN